MKPARPSLLYHPLFISSLALLLSNDFFWKSQYANWFTGKLSDIAGLVVLPVFCRVLWPRLSKTNIILGCALFFCWWKSPLSQPVLLFLQTNLHLPVQRVIDYTDLLALLVLPLTLWLQPVQLSLHPFFAKSVQWSIGMFTVFSLCATTLPYRQLFHAHPDMEDVFFHETITQKRTAEAVLQTLQAKGIWYKMDSVMYYPVVNQQNLYYRKQLSDSVSNWQQVSQAKDSTLYFKWEGSSYYLIPHYQSGSKTLRNIRFTLYENRKKTKTVITVETFLEGGLQRNAFLDSKQKKPYKTIFNQLFSAP